MHFTDDDYYLGENGNIMKKNNAIPTIRSNLEPDSDDEEIYGEVLSRSLPLYSSPALIDHHYAVLVPRDLTSEDFPESDCESVVDGTEDEAENVPDQFKPSVTSSIPQASIQRATENSTPPTSHGGSQRLNHAKCFK